MPRGAVSPPRRVVSSPAPQSPQSPQSPQPVRRSAFSPLRRRNGQQITPMSPRQQSPRRERKDLVSDLPYWISRDKLWYCEPYLMYLDYHKERYVQVIYWLILVFCTVTFGIAMIYSVKICTLIWDTLVVAGDDSGLSALADVQADADELGVRAINNGNDARLVEQVRKRHGEEGVVGYLEKKKALQNYPHRKDLSMNITKLVNTNSSYFKGMIKGTTGGGAALAYARLWATKKAVELYRDHQMKYECKGYWCAEKICDHELERDRTYSNVNSEHNRGKVIKILSDNFETIPQNKINTSLPLYEMKSRELNGKTVTGNTPPKNGEIIVLTEDIDIDKNNGTSTYLYDHKVGSEGDLFDHTYIHTLMLTDGTNSWSSKFKEGYPPNCFRFNKVCNAESICGKEKMK